MNISKFAGKVVCCGFHKTGTTSIAGALDLLGYRTCHGAGPVRSSLGDARMMELLYQADHDPILDVAAEFDGLADNPWFQLFAVLDVRFPGSRFVHTVRNRDAWLKSVLGHFGRSRTRIREWTYGKSSPVGNEDTYLARYDAHNRSVNQHFVDRPSDLLVLDLEKGDGWPALCDFLEVRPRVEGAFLHLNSRSRR